MKNNAPNSVESERALLGSVLLDNSVWSQLAGEIAAGEFFLPAHRDVYAAMYHLRNAGGPVDLVTLAEELNRRGQLESIGGAAYIASLTDGLPRVSNVGHYTEIVKRKAALRGAIQAAGNIIKAAEQEPEDLGRFLTMARESFPEPSANGRGGKPPLVALAVEELLAREIRPREMLLDPILPEQGLGMLYARRGDGKTFLALGMAVAVAGGGRFLRWNAPRPRRVFYVDGELPVKTLQERAAAIIAGAEVEPGPGMLRFITPDVQDRPVPDLATAEGQAAIEQHLEGVDLLVLDNLSALCRHGKENEGEGWLPVQEWALSLRRRGISVVFVHHAGKGGAQRGTSRREDLLDTVLAMRRPADYSPEEGLRSEVHFEKGRSIFGDSAKPFEVKLETDRTGAAVWTTRDLEGVQARQVADMVASGMSLRDIADELHISKSKVARLRDSTRDSKPGVPVSQPVGVGQWDSRANGGNHVGLD